MQTVNLGLFRLLGLVYIIYNTVYLYNKNFPWIKISLNGLREESQERGKMNQRVVKDFPRKILVFY